MFSSNSGISGTANLMVKHSSSKNPRWQPAAILDTYNGHKHDNVATSLPIDLLFSSLVEVSGKAVLTVNNSVSKNPTRSIIRAPPEKSNIYRGKNLPGDFLPVA